MSKLTMWVGPMYSGKSQNLIADIARDQYATPEEVACYQSTRNTRDLCIASRTGLQVQAQKIDSLFEILRKPTRVVAIDEAHFFSADQHQAIRQLLGLGTEVRIAGLDKDYRGQLFPIVTKLLELPDVHVVHLPAVCTRCKSTEAWYTQIYQGDEPVLDGLESAKVEDPTLRYEAACARCFKSSYF